MSANSVKCLLMKFEKPLIQGIILKRYKRFLSEIELPTGEIIIAHVPNTGSMKTCWHPGWKAYVSKTDNPLRKLKYTLELLHNGESFICINTSATNKIVKDALEQKEIPELAIYETIKSEQKIFDSRLDFLLSTGSNKAYVEVKNVTLLGNKKSALFPDAITTRGQKHLNDLIKIKQVGHRAVMLYIVNRQDVNFFSVAADIDPMYSRLLKKAVNEGVEVLVYQTKISTTEINILKKLESII